MFAPTYIANAVAFIAIVLQLFNIHIAPEALQTTVTTLLAIGVPLFTLIRQWWTGRSTVFGIRPR